MSPMEPTLLRDFPDRAIRRLLENPGNLRELLAAAVPDLVAGFDCDRAELQPPAFPLDDWRHRESDLLFLIPYRTGKGRRRVLVCVLIEHQSAADPRMPLRVLLYTVLFWEREWKEWEERPVPRPEFRLTPVLPIVFHTGARPWGATRTVAELIGGPEALRAFAPRYSPLFWDLAAQSPEALIESAAEWLQALAVIRAEGEAREEFFRVMREVAARLNGLASRDVPRQGTLARADVVYPGLGAATAAADGARGADYAGPGGPGRRVATRGGTHDESDNCRCPARGGARGGPRGGPRGRRPHSGPSDSAGDHQG